MLNSQNYYWELKGGEGLVDFDPATCTDDEKELAKADFDYILNVEMLLHERPPVEIVWRQGLELIKGGYCITLPKGFVQQNPMEEDKLVIQTGRKGRLATYEQFRELIEESIKYIYKKHKGG